MTSRIEEVVLSNLLQDVEYCRKVLPFLESAYFDDRGEKLIFETVKSFFTKHNSPPNKQIVKIELESRDDVKQSDYDDVLEKVEVLGEREPNQNWLLERTEKFCKDQAIYLSITESLSILEGRNTKFNREAIPSLLQNALSISFDKTIGHDFFEDADRRYDFYHLEEERVPFDLEMMNRITAGGLPKKTLNCVLAGCVHPDTKVKIRVKKRKL